ncbi:MAG: hypothetical protein J6P69_03735 [Bacteroidales bacterium]|nr:hypothetical protein [Bacteroidales bacterium]
MIRFTRYLFVYEGEDGDARLRDSVSRQMKDLDKGIDYDFHAAADPEEALRHVSLYCDLHKDIDTCFVACGGDALTAAVAGGLMGAGEGKTLGVYDPSGTNSLAKYYEGMDFGSLAKLVDGTPAPIDMIRVNNSYAVNACVMGLESMVDGKGLTPSLSAVLKSSFRSVKITVDGVALDTGSVFLFTLANGKYAGGGLHCAPLALNNDGKMDLCVIRNMPPARLSKVLHALASGTLADEPTFAGDYTARRAKSVEVECAKDITLSLDGCPLIGKEFKARVVPSAVRLVVPAE